MGKPKNYMKIIDDEEIFHLYYVEMGPRGSTNKIWEGMRRKGIINPSTGRPITKSAIWHAITRYKVRNWKDVKDIVQRYYIDSGYAPMSDEEYKEMISKQAKTIFHWKQYEHYLEANPELPDMRE